MKFKKYIFFFVGICVILSAVFLYLNGYRAPRQEYTEEQLDALSRIDPLHILTDNYDAFDSRDTLLEALNSGRFGSDVTNYSPKNGFFQAPFYGVSEPMNITFVTKGGKIITLRYGITSLLDRPYDLVEDHVAWFKQMHQDVLTVYGEENYRENIPYEEALQKIEQKEEVDYTISYDNEYEASFSYYSNPQSSERGFGFGFAFHRWRES